MKKTFLLLCIICFFILGTKSASAQDQQGITISPSILVFDEKDLGKTQEITIYNNSLENITFNIAEGTVIRDKQGKILPINTKITDPLIELSQTQVTLNATSHASIKIRAKLANLNTEHYPAVTFTAIAPKGSNNSKAQITTAFVIPVITQNTEAELNADNNIKVDYSIVSFNSNFNISGDINNLGGKFFEPSGSIIVYKDDIKIYEKQITSQVQGLLFPKESRPYDVNWSNNLEYFKRIGNYTIESRINASSTDKAFIGKIQFFYLPIDIFLLLLVSGIVLLLFLIRVGNKLRAKRIANLT